MQLKLEVGLAPTRRLFAYGLVGVAKAGSSAEASGKPDHSLGNMTPSFR